MTSRRDFLGQSALAAAGIALPVAHRGIAPTARSSTFLDLIRPPDTVTVHLASEATRLSTTIAGRWEGGGVTVTARPDSDRVPVTIAAPGSAVERIHLRWRGSIAGVQRILGDAWERGYGDLEWRGFVPDRVMPWYAATWDGSATHCYGVSTDPAAFCSWQVDLDGISLWVDVRSGGSGVQLGGRTLAACEVTCREGSAGESPFTAVHHFCRQMCPAPRLPDTPVYGANDWYYNYGDSSEAKILAETGLIVELSPTGGNRPFSVIDDGWQPERGENADRFTGQWDRGNAKFPDMQGLAARIRREGALPGIWIRPLLATTDTPESMRLPRDRRVLDPTVDGALEKVAADIARLRAWGYELIKHDYSTWDIFGRWGFQMGAALTKSGWTFAAGPTHTTAEVINRLYATIRTAAGSAGIIGCNTVSHLSAGRFEMFRIGDDTSGTEWARTRRMGVNSLAFRGMQHGAFYAADPDCVGVTGKIPWHFNRQWLDLVARSGTMLFASLDPAAVGAPERRDLKTALALAATPQPIGEATDWQVNSWPDQWRLLDQPRAFDWIGADGLDAVG